MIWRTILWSHHARTGKNREIQLNQQTILCQVLVNWIRFGAVSYLLSCMWRIIWNFLNINLMNSNYLFFRPDDYTLETFLSEFLKRKWWISSTNKCISVVWLKLKETQSWLAKSTLIRTLLFLNLGMYKVIWILSEVK